MLDVHRRQVLVAAGALLGTLHTARAQQTARMVRLGYLSEGSAPSSFEESLLKGMRDLGYVEGRNLAVEYRWAAHEPNRLPSLAADLVRLNVDVIVVSGTPAARAAKEASTTIPIVMIVGNALGAGLVESLARPGGNATGLSLYTSELSQKRLEIFRETVPRLTHVGAALNELNPRAPQLFQEAAAAGDALGMKVAELGIRFPDGIEPGFEAAAGQGVQGIVILSDTATITYRTRLGTAGLRYRLPTMFSNRAYLEGGGLMSYGTDIIDVYRRAAGYVDRLLKGTKTTDLPVEQPTRFELAVNVSTARALELAIPPAVLARADHLIE